MDILKDIPDFHNWTLVEPIKKGWSSDKKYYIKTKEGKELLLRTSDISLYERKKSEYHDLKSISNMDILMSCPIDFGVCNNGQSVYMLFTWISGQDAEDVLPSLSLEDQYKLGFKAGKVLKQIHNIPAPSNIITWESRFNKKIDKKISAYRTCGIKFQGDYHMINYIENHRYLLKDRPQTLHHGDYHLGNMIITPDLQLGIIDFNRMDFGDPWEEFNRIHFCAETSPIFASGYINGYFNDKVPDEFFKLMALYIANNQISSIPWAIPFGEDEVNTMLDYTQKVLAWYDDFKTHIPSWYMVDG